MSSIPWSYAPYKPFFFETGDIYVCRISPDEHGFDIAWLAENDGEYTVNLRKRDNGDFAAVKTVNGSSARIDGLEADTDYEVFISQGEAKSRVRLVRCGYHIGIAVNYLHPDDRAYSFSGNFLCSPSMVRHPDGYLLASMDLFKGNAPQNLTLIFRSDDDGATWKYVSELMPCFWGRLFVHKGELYMISCSTEYGDLLIGKSVDGGKTFGAPTVIIRGSNGKDGNAGIHKNPQNVLVYNNRIYITIEWGSWGSRFHAATVISCDCDDDLLDYASWAIPHPVKYDKTIQNTVVGDADHIEGTLVVSPENELLNIMRFQMGSCTPNHGYAIVYKVNTEEHTKPLEFVRMMEFPANHSKFMIKWDEVSGKYYTIASRITDNVLVYSRNLLSFMSSADLVKWDVVCDLVDERDKDPFYIGFQYVDFIIEGDDIIWLCRTAQNGAENYHNSNYITFHKIKDFRNI